MTTNKQREAVADALYGWLIANNGNGGKKPYNRLTEEEKERWLYQADVAIAAYEANREDNV